MTAGNARFPAAGTSAARVVSVPRFSAFDYTGALTDTYTAGSSGYVHDGARWYNPQTGTWAGQDTDSYLNNPANGNRYAYAYAADNPTTNTDPTGMCSGLLGCLEYIGEATLGGATTGSGAGFGIGCIVSIEIGCIEGAGVGSAVGFFSGGELGFLYSFTQVLINNE